MASADEKVKQHPLLRSILYEKQPFPDNHVDDSFLNELQKNVNIRYYRVSEAIVETGIVTQEICSVILFTSAFAFLDDGRLQPQTLLGLAFLGALALYVLHKCFGLTANDRLDRRGDWCFVDAGDEPRSVAGDVKVAAIYLALTFVFSPVLKTLTETTSSDTVYAMATAALMVHLVVHDYGPTFALVSAPLSFNAAIFGVVCLASRLPDSMSVLALVTTSVVMFALIPHVRRQLHQRCSRGSWACLTALIFCLATVVLSLISNVATVCFLLAIAFINIICPIWFVSLQKYKENVYGPWDEVILKLS